MSQAGGVGNKQEIPEVSPDEVKESAAQGKPGVILDVREEVEWIRGHIPGATWIPLGELMDRVDELPKDEAIVAVCRSGNRSSAATKFLNAQGLNTFNMTGGMLAWEGEVQTGRE